MMCIRTFLYSLREKSKDECDSGCTGVSATRRALCSHPCFSFSDCVVFTSCDDNIVSWLLVCKVCSLIACNNHRKS